MKFKNFLNEKKFSMGYITSSGKKFKKIALKAIKYLETKWKDVPIGIIDIGGHSVSDVGIGGFRVGVGNFDPIEYSETAFSLLPYKLEVELRELFNNKNIPKEEWGFLIDFFHEAAHTSGIKSELKAYEVGSNHLKKFLKSL